MAADCGFCTVFKDRGEAYNASRIRVGGRRSLKTQQHAGVVCGHSPPRSPSSQRNTPACSHPARFGRHARPDPLSHHSASRAL